MKKEINELPYALDALKALDRWAVCRTYRDHKYVEHKKKPCRTRNPNLGAMLGISSTWGSYKRTIDRLRRPGQYNGIIGLSIDLSDSGYFVVDMDGCVMDGKMSENARSIMYSLATYAEYSMSGTGIHLVGIGNAGSWTCNSSPVPGMKKFEIGSNHWITLTGNVVPGFDIPPRDCLKSAFEFRDSFRPARVLSDTYDDAPDVDVSNLGVPSVKERKPTVEEVLDAISKNDDAQTRWLSFLGGAEAAGYSDHSSADLALLGFLRHWTGGHRDVAETIFTLTPLGTRSKWSRDDYRDKTWDACNDTQPRMWIEEQPNGLVLEEGLSEPDFSKWGIISGAELNRSEPTPHEWIIKDWVPVGLTKLISPEKSGKTFLCMQMAVSVASGADFLGSFAVKKGKALYLGFEQSQNLNHERLLSLVGGGQIPENLDIVSAGSSWPPLDAGGLNRLNQYIKLKQPVLIVIDVWQEIAPMAKGRDNAYQSDSKSLRPLHALANTSGVAILFIHHTRKGMHGPDPSDATSGSRALDSVPDHNIFLLREHGTCDAIVKTKTRVARPIEDMAIKFCPETCLWEFVGSGNEHTLNIQRLQLLDVVRECDGEDDAMTVAAILDLLSERGIERKFESVRRQLERMHRDGQIMRTSNGRRNDPHRYYASPPEDLILPTPTDGSPKLLWDEDSFLAS